MVAATEFAENVQEAVDTVLDASVPVEKKVPEKKSYEPCDMEKLVYLRNFEAKASQDKVYCYNPRGSDRCDRFLIFTLLF